MLPIFHPLSHLSYPAKLAGSAFAPVPSPAGRLLRTDEPAASESCDFFDMPYLFDVLHLHTVELATVDDSERMTAHPAGANDGLVFTSHDLAPNIEADVHYELYFEHSPEKT
ncbi:hypothetical protein [Candidatus Protofrankia californiensis]|uniref:hypothetical protein n=1 Tax=Candidatus Protofrankia californiensis TaxID=1839754 RepID=UPI001041139C|nr:hypothetical protein [Candidatus Protofrankia californiensis]